MSSAAHYETEPFDMLPILESLIDLIILKIIGQIGSGQIFPILRFLKKESSLIDLNFLITRTKE